MAIQQPSLNQCEDLGKFLRRANISIDIINFANTENVPKLKALVSVVDKDHEISSHFMDVPLGMGNITDLIILHEFWAFVVIELLLLTSLNMEDLTQK